MKSRRGTLTNNQDFQDFLDSMDNDFFEGQTMPKNKQNVNKIREKTLLKIEKSIKKLSNEKNDGRRES